MARCTFHPTTKKEVALLPRYQPRNQTPTHRVDHINGRWSAELALPESIQKGLESPDDETRRTAGDFIAVQFRKACERQYPGPGQFNLKLVSFGSLELSPLVPDQVFAGAQAGATVD